MKVLLAIVIAMVSAVLGALLVSMRVNVRMKLWVLLVSVAAGALVAEGITVFWMGPPAVGIEPGIDGLLLGVVVSWLAGRKPRKPKGPPTPPKM